MTKIATTWNAASGFGLTNLFSTNKEIRLRGWNKDTYLSFDVSRSSVDGRQLGPLSIHDSSLGICPSHRDSYIQNSSFAPKALKKLRNETGAHWKDRAGDLLELAMKKGRSYESSQRPIANFSASVRSAWGGFTSDPAAKKLIRGMYKHPTSDEETIGVDLFLSGLGLNFASEVSYWCMDNCLFAGDGLTTTDVALFPDGFRTEGDPLGIGDATPDIVVKRIGMVGEVKMGKIFHSSYLRAVAGYALAYESCFHEEVNWGVVYFLQTSVCSEPSPVEPITGGHTYLFRVNDTLRSLFLQGRDDIYAVLGSPDPPSRPGNKKKCHKCKYSDACDVLDAQDQCEK